METAKFISGVHSVNPNMIRRSEIAQSGVVSGNSGETPPSGVVDSAGQSQTVAQLTGADKSALSERGHEPDRQKLSDAVKNMNDFLQMARRTLEFSMDDASGKMVVKITDTETNKVIRQIPSETMLKIAKELGHLSGLLLEEKA